VIAETGRSKFLVEAIRERERELAQLTHELETVQRDSVKRHPGNLRDFVRTGLKDLLALLRFDAIRARAELAKYTAEIRMIPERTAGGELHYVAEGSWNLFAGEQLCVGCGGRI
jgi:hypothetical protein